MTINTVSTHNSRHALALVLCLCFLALTTTRAFAPLSSSISNHKTQITDTKNHNDKKESRHYYTNLTTGSKRRNKVLYNMKSPETTSVQEEESMATKAINKAVPILSEQEEDKSSDASALKDDKECAIATEPEEELSETKKLLKQVKEAGTAGVISYALWELGFWAFSVPVCISAYYGLFGHFPDLTNKEDLSKLGGEAFAFVNFARFAVPLRIGLALSTTPWIQENVVDKFFNKKDSNGENCQEE
mmetsp:Transcript_14990/g.28210  ORF Transcript_14990/g.28210 Transcript_14990/m.28210 type:complete len:246 (-) Transcript_14990:222-959(-)